MTDTRIFTLAQIIKAAGSNPGDITCAVWVAGYRKSERTPEEAVAVTIEILKDYVGNMPPDACPGNWNEVQMSELNNIIAEAEFPPGSTAVEIAKAVIKAGYRKGGHQ